MRVGGRSEEGVAKPLSVDSDGRVNIKSERKEVSFHYSASSNEISDEVDVVGFGSLALHVGGNFNATVIVEGSIISGLWEILSVVDSTGETFEGVLSRGIYKADIAGVKKIRTRIISWVSGTSLTVNGIATVVGSSKDLTVNVARQNSHIFSQTDAYLIGRDLSFYGKFTRGTSDPNQIIPVDYKNHIKKTVFVRNGFDVPIRIERFYKYLNPTDAGNDFLERVYTDIVINPGNVGRLSYVDYPELLDPFGGLAIGIQSRGGNDRPTTGEVKIDWLGGK